MPEAIIQAGNYRIKVEDLNLTIVEDPVAPATEGIIVGDLWGFISDVNEFILKLYGSDDKNIFVGKHIAEFLVQKEKSRAIQNSLDIIAEGKPKSYVYLVKLKNGEEATFEITADFVKNEKSETVGFIDYVRQVITK